MRLHHLSLLALVLGVVCVGGSRGAEPISADQLRFFELRIRPLLARNCYKCHGPNKQEAELRLDSRPAMLQGGETGHAIVSGKPAESLLIEAINYESLEMPPDGQLSDKEIADLVEWVRLGAPWPDDRLIPPEKLRAAKISDEDRAFWSFRPVRAVDPPKIANNGWARNGIDGFIFRRLKSEGLAPADEATRPQLIRRAYFDLIGLPPAPDDMEAFLNDASPTAYEAMIDRLLDSPRYGERWARHWLDLVRYAESDGYKQDAYRPNAWRYRDYVIRSFNDDKPYDQFVQEQLAGDETAPENPDSWVATSLLRHGIYEYNQRDVRTQWNTMLNDVTDVTGDVFLGMGMGCARCHDHKFDPILQEDYFRLRAFFAPLLPRDDLPIGSADELAEYRAKRTEWEKQTAEIRRQIDEIERPHYERAARPAIEKFPPDIRPMMRKRPEDRLPLEQQLAELAYRQVQAEYDKLDVAGKLKGDEKTQWESLKKQLAEFDHLKPAALPTAFTVTDLGSQAPPTVIPGDDKRRDIAPGFLSVLDPSDAKIMSPTSGQSTGRRTALARWITDPNNPLTTRVIVNRIWQHHFGQGLVATSSDFGQLGRPPTHPELLDWLATYFIDNGWSFKKLHRLIMTSATYRQSALRETPKVAAMKDPGNQLLWRMQVRRLDAEQIRDAMLAATGELDATSGGASVARSSKRRSIYMKVLRNQRDPLLAAFDAPDGFNSVSQRDVTTTATQSLMMINGAWTLDRAKALAMRLKKLNLSQEELVERAYRIAYGRQLVSDETIGAIAFLREQAEQAAASKSADAALAEKMPHRSSLAALLNRGSRQPRLQVADNPSLPSGDFTIEAVIFLRSLYADATVRTIVAQWDSNTGHPGWALGVTSTKSAYQPRNLILQLVGDPKKGGAGYEVIPSNLRPELNKPYYVAVSVKLSETGKTGVTFYMKDLSSEDAALKTASVTHKVTSHYRSNVALTIGSRDQATRHFWDGLIDDVRVSNSALSASELLVNGGAKSAATVGFWKFDSTDQAFFEDASPHGNDIVRTMPTNSDPQFAAMVDLCHVLLNSNEFLYVD